MKAGTVLISLFLITSFRRNRRTYIINSILLKPKKRSKLRIFAGRNYFTLKRYLWWYLGNTKFTKTKQDTEFSYTCFCHKSLLLRQLKDVDMYLQYNKIRNLKIAVNKLNHILIRPGETFSYWKLIGKPTGKKGYTEGMILFCGSVKSGIGGGLCQLSNLIYWMAVHTPLTIVERYRHSYDVFPDSDRTQPFGSGATCVYNYRDLMIKNETAMTFQLCLTITETHLTGSIKSSVSPSYTYEVYEKEHRMDSEYWGGFSRHNILYRKIYDMAGNLAADEYVTENHALMMYNPFLAEKDSFT